MPHPAEAFAYFSSRQPLQRLRYLRFLRWRQLPRRSLPLPPRMPLPGANSKLCIILAPVRPAGVHKQPKPTGKLRTMRLSHEGGATSFSTTPCFAVRSTRRMLNVAQLSGSAIRSDKFFPVASHRLCSALVQSGQQRREYCRIADSIGLPGRLCTKDA